MTFTRAILASLMISTLIPAPLRAAIVIKDYDPENKSRIVMDLHQDNTVNFRWCKFDNAKLDCSGNAFLGCRGEKPYSRRELYWQEVSDRARGIAVGGAEVTALVLIVWGGWAAIGAGGTAAAGAAHLGGAAGAAATAEQVLAKLIKAGGYSIAGISFFNYLVPKVSRALDPLRPIDRSHTIEWTLFTNPDEKREMSKPMADFRVMLQESLCKIDETKPDQNIPPELKQWVKDHVADFVIRPF